MTVTYSSVGIGVITFNIDTSYYRNLDNKIAKHFDIELP